jgi:Myb/SANT-like DNA-binding domain
MAALPVVPYNPPLPLPFQWTINAAIQLIRERRQLNDRFARRRHHGTLWTNIANNVFAITGLAVIPNQCKIKWRTLKRGFENSLQIARENSEDFPFDSPNSFDEACFTELSDQFWVQTSNYLF